MEKRPALHGYENMPSTTLDYLIKHKIGGEEGGGQNMMNKS